MRLFIVKYTIVFIASLIFILVFSSQALAKDAQVIVDSSQYSSAAIGKEFEVTVKLKVSEPILSAKIYLLFDSALMQPLTIDREKSRLPYWWENAYFVGNGRGIVKLQASIPTPGVEGDINIAVLKLKKLKIGNAVFKVDPSSAVLNSQNKNLLPRSGILGMILSLLGNIPLPTSFETPLIVSGLIATVIAASVGIFFILR